MRSAWPGAAQPRPGAVVGFPAEQGRLLGVWGVSCVLWQTGLFLFWLILNLWFLTSRTEAAAGSSGDTACEMPGAQRGQHAPLSPDGDAKGTPKGRFVDWRTLWRGTWCLFIYFSREPTEPPCPIPKGAKLPQFLHIGKWVGFPYLERMGGTIERSINVPGGPCFPQHHTLEPSHNPPGWRKSHFPSIFSPGMLPWLKTHATGKAPGLGFEEVFLISIFLHHLGGVQGGYLLSFQRKVGRGAAPWPLLPALDGAGQWRHPTWRPRFLERKRIFLSRFWKGHPGHRAGKLVRSPSPCGMGRKGLKYLSYLLMQRRMKQHRAIL